MSAAGLRVDEAGFLLNRGDWTPEVAAQLAAERGIELTAIARAVLLTVRDFHARTDVSPAMRPLVKLLRETHGQDVGNSIFLHQTFGESPAKEIARLAGLPKPTNCL
ncbi:MAG: TusE/DsrC/DsvC family sulfur relay protein [Pseudomonadota bacterium]